MPTKSQQKKYCTFLQVTHEKSKTFHKLKLEKKKLNEEKRIEILDQKVNCKHIYYGLGGNTLFPRIFKQTINNLYNKR